MHKRQQRGGIAPRCGWHDRRGERGEALVTFLIASLHFGNPFEVELDMDSRTPNGGVGVTGPVRVSGGVAAVRGGTAGRGGLVLFLPRLIWSAFLKETFVEWRVVWLKVQFAAV